MRGASRAPRESAGCGDRQIDDLGFEISVFCECQDAEGDGEVEAAGAAGAGVEVEDSCFGDVVGDVGVAVKDGGEFGGGLCGGC